MKKRIFSLGIVVLMLVTFLIACSSNNSNGNNGSTASTTGVTASSDTAGAQSSNIEPVTLKYLNCWNGSAASGLLNPSDNPVGNVIQEKTGVTLDVEYATMAENEKLNLVFASGDLPDFINAPYWGGSDACTQILKKAATQGQLLPLDEYIAKAGPDMKNVFSEGVAKDFQAIDLEGPEFGGKHYIMPFQKPLSDSDVSNYAYGVYARKDILETINVKSGDIMSSEDIYQLLKKIKAGNFKDTTGKPVIPAGCWSNGWAYETLMNSYMARTTTEFVKQDGKYILDVFTPLVEKQILYMRRLVSEGLFDVEAFRQTEPRAQEKMALAQVAMVGANADKMYNWYNDHLKKDYPQMEYIPIGPIADANGVNAMPGTVNQYGRAGTPAVVITKSCKNPEAVIRFLNYVNSEEGIRLVKYGVEGVHYDLVDGKPVPKADFLSKYNSNKLQTQRETGIRCVYNIVCLEGDMNRFGELDIGQASTGKPEMISTAENMYPLIFKDGFKISSFRNQYPKIDEINTTLNGTLRRDTFEKAIFAKTDAEALKILNTYREQLKKGGYEEYEKFLNDQVATRSDVIN